MSLVVEQSDTDREGNICMNYWTHPSGFSDELNSPLVILQFLAKRNVYPNSSCLVAVLGF